MLPISGSPWEFQPEKAMHRATLILATTLAASTIACVSKTPGIELTSSDFDLSPLVGVWRGNYSNPQNGRAGTIGFSLRAGESFASGNVVMIPKADSLLTPEEREVLSDLPTAGRSVIPIRFLRKEGGNLTGTLDPYRLPDCDCTVTTNFQGKFTDANSIAGTFTTVPSKPGSTITSGTWKVTRVKKL
jgi:hypothetical protein